MTPAQPDKIWWTARELAEAALPDMPASRQNVEAMVKRLNWRSHPDFARRRKGRGGGWEYHWKLLPMNAQKALLAQVAPVEPVAPPHMDRDEAWTWYEGLPDRVTAKARHRLEIIQKVEALVLAGTTKFLAIAEVARMDGASERTIWNWFEMIEGVSEADRLPYLAPKHRGAKRAVRKAECSDEFWDYVRADILRLEAPSIASSYRRACRVAREEGWSVLPERTLRRRIKAEIPETTWVLCRKGVEALKRMYPAQTRDRTTLHAMEAVNADYHRFDVFVAWPLPHPSNETEIVRAQLVAFQDVHSGRILSWRIDKTPNKVGVSLALGDMIERFGIPEHILLDNGREFANKFLTGGTPTRFRFKVKDDDIPGILTTLGCKVHWATPYSGQSKPIERAFRDMCDDIAKDPRFAGAYTGNKPDAKPENYGETAIPLDRFIKVVEEGIEEHNMRTGRRGQTTQGRSLLETFEDSYASAPIRLATPEQRRLWLMGAEGVRPNRHTGVIKFEGNEYWAPWLHEHMGQKMVARFDPADLHAGLYLYALDGGYLGDVDCKLKAGFFDVEAARSHAAARRKWQKAEKAAAAQHRKLKVVELGQALDGARREAPAPVEAKVVKPVFSKPKSRPKPASTSPEKQAKHSAFVARFEAKKAERPAPPKQDDDARALFRRALEIEARLKDGEPVGEADERWLQGYQTTPEYKANVALMERFGADMFG